MTDTTTSSNSGNSGGDGQAQSQQAQQQAGQQSPTPADMPQQQPETPKTFTQAQLDALIADRVARERGKFADYDSLKAKADEYDQAQEANASEQEKAVKQARKEARTEAMKEANGRLAAAVVREHAAGRIPDVDALLEGSDMTRFVTGDDIDRDAIKAWVERIAPAPEEPSEQSTGPGVLPKQAWADLAAGGRPAAETDPGFGSARVRSAYAAGGNRR